MHLSYSDEQAMLRDSVARYLRDNFSFNQRNALLAYPTKAVQQVWRELSDLGLTGILVPEEYGGIGGSMRDLHGVLREAGASLLVAPLVSSAVLSTVALVASDATSVQKDYLPLMASGDLMVSWAGEQVGGAPAARATFDGTHWRLSGGVRNVSCGASAGGYIVTAQLGSPGSGSAEGLFLVDRKNQVPEAVKVAPYRLVDASPAATVNFFDAVGLPLFHGDASKNHPQVMEQVRTAGMVAACADGLGSVEAAIQLTSEYVRNRRQFGKPLADNQAVRHKIAEMLVGLESIKSMSLLAAIAYDEPDSAMAGDVARAKLILSVHGRKALEDAIQLHGGIGMTEEYSVGHYLQRFVVFDSTFGDADQQAEYLAKLQGDTR